MKKTILTFLFLTYCSVAALYAQVGMTTNSPDRSAALDISANNKGLLVPRVSLQNVTDKASITGGNPAEGLLVYNTNITLPGGAGHYYWDGSKWQKIINTTEASQLAWSTNGNAGTNPALNYVGTSNATDLQVKTNGVARVTITNAKGNVGIGNTTPHASSVLDMGTTATKAVRLPQVALTSETDITTVPNPQKGMLVYNTTIKQINTFDGSKWIQPIASNLNVVTPQLMAIVKNTNANVGFAGGNLWFDTKTYDPENAVTLGTSSSISFVYTVKQKGKHQIFVNMALNTISASQTWYLRIKQNGIPIAAIDVTAIGAGSSACLVTIADFNVNDKITIDKGANGTGWKGGGLTKATIFRFQ